MTPTHIIALTVSCIDYLSLHSVWVLDRATGDEIDTTVLSPGDRSATLAASLGDGPARARTSKVNIDIDEFGGGTLLRGTAPRVSFEITAAAAGRTRCGGTGPPAVALSTGV